MLAITSYELGTYLGALSIYPKDYICIWFRIGKSQKAIVKHTTNNIASINSQFNILFENWDLRFKI